MTVLVIVGVVLAPSVLLVLWLEACVRIGRWRAKAARGKARRDRAAVRAAEAPMSGVCKRHGCGNPLPPSLNPGRERTWCSERCRKSQYAGTCVDCGTPTNGYDGPGKASLRCHPCRKEFEKTDMASRVKHGHAKGNVRWSDDQIFDAIRSVAVDGAVSFDDYKAAYNASVRGTMPSPPILIRRFGLWSVAVTQADLRTKDNRRGPYASRMPDEGLLLAIETCWAEIGRPPTYSEYVDFARRVGAPSGTTIRCRCGSWLDALRACEAYMTRTAA